MFLASTIFFIALVSYGFLNAWMWDRARRAFPVLDRRAPSVLGLAAVLILVAAPVATRILDSNGFHRAASAMAFVGDPWTAIVFWFCVIALPLDLWDHVLRVVAWRRPGAMRLALGARGQFLAALSVTAFLAAWGVVEANHVHPRTIHIATAKLAAASKPLTIAQVSDVHVGIGSRRTIAEQAARLIRERSPDLIVATGDVFDSGDPASLDLSPLAALQAPLGKFGILGNHEYYTGPAQCLAALRKAGFRMLVDEAVMLPLDGSAGITLVGHDDPGRRHATLLHKTALEKRALPDFDTSTFVLSLRHRPDVAPPDREPFDLQLSGHTHQGQIWPFRYLIRLAHRYVSGLYDLGAGRRLYVSRGTGTWGPPMRFLSPPEVTFVVLVPLKTVD